MKQGELGWEPEGGKGEKRKKQRERERERKMKNASVMKRSRTILQLSIKFSIWFSAGEGPSARLHAVSIENALSPMRNRKLAIINQRILIVYS